MANSRNDGKIKGAQQHAEGAHGAKTHARIIEQLQSGSRDRTDEPKAPREGKHRLAEGREQHDEADLSSEKRRLDQHD